MPQDPNSASNSVRVIMVGGRGSPNVLEHVFAQNSISIGRPDPSSPGDIPDLNLVPDMKVSRRHAVLTRDRDRWWIEDRGSRQGTTVSGRDIRDGGAVPLEFGAIVQTGDTRWLMVPADWWTLRFSKVMFAMPVGTVANYTLAHCGLPILRELVIVNLGSETLTAMDVRAQVIGYGGSSKLRIPRLGPGERILLRVPPIPFDTTALRSQVEPARTLLRMDIDGLPDARGEREITVLGFRDWSFEPAHLRTLAAFVSPRNPAVERVVAEAQRGVQRRHPNIPSYRALLRSGRDDAECDILRAIYDCLAERGRIHYEDPHLRYDGDRHAYQTIRPPHGICPTTSARAEGRATCLDLALLIAGCLENVGLCPLVILLGPADGTPRHALAACWAGAAPGATPIISDAAQIIEEVKAGHIYAVESTGVAIGAHNSSLSFEEAAHLALALLEKAGWVSAVDIMALRPPSGTVTPLESPYEPEVMRIYDEARSLAVRLGTRNIETTHLFAGFLYANGEIAQQLCRWLHLDPLFLRRRLEVRKERRDIVPGLTPTQNYLECQQLAEKLAWEAGYPSVREEDVMWALLQKSRQSPKLQAACNLLGINLEQIRELLAAEHPSPSFPSTQTFTGW